MQRREVLRLAAGVFVPNCPGLASRPEPKFQIGDRVYDEYLCDDDLDVKHYGKMRRFYGTVIGLVWFQESWLYVVMFDDHRPNFSMDWEPWEEKYLVAA